MKWAVCDFCRTRRTGAPTSGLEHKRLQGGGGCRPLRRASWGSPSSGARDATAQGRAHGGRGATRVPTRWLSDEGRGPYFKDGGDRARCESAGAPARWERRTPMPEGNGDWEALGDTRWRHSATRSRGHRGQEVAPLGRKHSPFPNSGRSPMVSSSFYSYVNRGPGRQQPAVAEPFH